MVSGDSRELLDSSEEEEGLDSREEALKGNPFVDLFPSLKEAAAYRVGVNKEKMVEENGLPFICDTGGNVFYAINLVLQA